MKWVALSIPSGLLTEGTDLMAAGRWRLGDKVRWFKGFVQPIGGSQLALSAPLAGFPSAAHAWHYRFTGGRLVIGTNEKLYLFDGSDAKDITPSGLRIGASTNSTLTGYGVGYYGSSTYGTPRPSSSLNAVAALWSMDNFGAYWVGVRSDDGTLFKYDPDNDTLAVPIPNAPKTSLAVVTKEKALLAVGAGNDPRKIAWSTFEDYTVWNADSTNSAGDLQLDTEGSIVGAIRCAQGVLIFTQLDVHLLNFIGGTYVYGLTPLAKGVSCISLHAATVTPNVTVWMGLKGFYTFDGYVKPLACEVTSYVFDNLNFIEGAKVYSAINSTYNEVWWFYPSLNATQCDRYVCWNYEENIWSLGTLARSVWIDKGVMDNVLALSPEGYLYQQETGFSQGSVTTAPISMDTVRTWTAHQLINDELGANYQISVQSKLQPNASWLSYGNYQVRADGYTDIRASGREISFTFNSLPTSVLWKVGQLRLGYSIEGQR